MTRRFFTITLLSPLFTLACDVDDGSRSDAELNAEAFADDADQTDHADDASATPAPAALASADCVGDTCTAALLACGDGVLDAGEACDDGNTLGDDGCEFCQVKTSTGTLYAMGTHGNGFTFRRFSEATQTWTPLAVAPSFTYATLTNDGTSVYMLSSPDGSNDASKNNRIYRYTPATNTWENVGPGPGLKTEVGCGGNARDLFSWVGDGFYLINNYCQYTNGTEVWRFRNNTWTRMEDQTYRASGAGTYDAVSRRLYVRQNGNPHDNYTGIITVDTTAATGGVTRFSNSPQLVDSGSNAGAFSRDSFYRHGGNPVQPIVRYTLPSWTRTDTNLYPAANLWNIAGSTWETDHGNGNIYIMTVASTPRFVRYDPTSNTLSSPLPSPSSYAWGTPTMTVMRPL